MYTFTPIVQEFTPTGIHTTKLFHLFNPGEKPIALECFVTKRYMDIEGAENNSEEEAEELFLVYPSQIILPAGRKQLLRVQWLGDSDLKEELSFRLICRQLPINLKKPDEDEEEANENAIEFLYNYAAAIYVVPRGVKPDIKIESTQVIEGEEGEKLLEIVFNNNGSKHQLMRDLSVKIASKEENSKDVTIDVNAFKGGVNILAKHKRRYTFPWPEENPQDNLIVTFEFLGK